MPVCMAEFWWGASPVGEVRHHGHFYPACRSKCKPILDFMLQGLDVEDNRLEMPTEEDTPLEVVYDDRWLTVLNKPSGMLTVPGKALEDSLLNRYKEAFPEAHGPVVVHRLDQETSGLVVFAKDKATHKALQQQFESHTIKKRYIALLDGQVPQDEGIIDLPLLPDVDDRPRQRVDHALGKPAVTRYRVLERMDAWTRIALEPLTGRTHQLRVHCYCGYADDGGHAFILDGFNADGYFHVNWGWGGSFDGYFVVSLLSPYSSMDFKYLQDGLFGLVPEPQTDMIEEVLYLRSRLTPVTQAVPLGQEATVDIDDFLVQGNKATRENTYNGETRYYADIPLSLSVFDSNGVVRQSVRYTHTEILGQGRYTSGWSLNMVLPSSLEEGEYRIKLLYSEDGGLNYDHEVCHHYGKDSYIKMVVRGDTAYLSDRFLLPTRWDCP